jgi:hypothetical protein
MAKRSFFYVLILVLLVPLFAALNHSERWGFWGHRRINRMAVFTLPSELVGFYKKNIEYVTEHAVDPDKRRYATKFEAVRHYIDIDHWGEYPFEGLPRRLDDAVMKYASLSLVTAAGDTVNVRRDTINDRAVMTLALTQQRYLVDYEETYRDFFREHIYSQYYEDEWILECGKLDELFGLPEGTLDCQRVFAVDHFTEYGIVPYFLPIIQNQLTEAFIQKNIPRILRLSAEIGHYIGDAHVPLHTTLNYNGQLTDQVGIHAFWESRIPELFADKEYDFFVGKAIYIDDPAAYFWEVVLESHQLVDSVLLIEKRLSETYPEDKQYCYEERLGRTIRTQCQEYAAAYQEAMGGMVEARMRKTIVAVGSCWYTAWIDAGQPKLSGADEYELSPEELRELERLNAEVQKGENKGRAHE